jgi:hypothetical protein
MVHASIRSLRPLSRIAALFTLVSTGVGGVADAASAAVPGTQLWAKPYNGPANGTDVATALAVSPDGSEVFVTGQSPSSTTGVDYTTVAHDASTGARSWVSRYDGSGTNDYATAMGVPSRARATGSSVSGTAPSTTRRPDVLSRDPCVRTPG